MAKTEVYSWRLDPATKVALEDAARKRRASVAAVLDEIVEDWMSRRSTGSDTEEQEALHQAASRYIGAIEGGDPHRAQASRQRLRERLGRRRAGA
jgi:hypothetical protein